MSYKIEMRGAIFDHFPGLAPALSRFTALPFSSSRIRQATKRLIERVRSRSRHRRRLVLESGRGALESLE